MPKRRRYIECAQLIKRGQIKIDFEDQLGILA